LLSLIFIKPPLRLLVCFQEVFYQKVLIEDVKLFTGFC